jgi:copper chaperone CopZ
MFIFSVKDMRVSSQAAAVLNAVNHADGHASVSINLSTHEVHISPSTAGATELSDAISHAGFDPVLNDYGRTGRGLHQALLAIPFEGFDHDFSASAEGLEEPPSASIAGASRLNSLLPAEALGPLAH